MKLFSHCDWFNHIYFQQRDIILSLPLYFIYVNLAHYLLLNISSRWVFYFHFLLLILELLEMKQLVHYLSVSSRGSAYAITKLRHLYMCTRTLD